MLKVLSKSLLYVNSKLYNVGQIDVQSQDGRRLILSLCKDVSNGVAHLHHQANVIPNDLGARTCQITSQLIVKVSFSVKM